MNSLELYALNKSYGPLPAVEAVTLSVPAGSRTAIVGPSGSGKTTLLRMIAGFEFPDSGRIMLDGESMAGGGRIVPAHRRRIGYVPQDGALFPHLTVAGNIGFGLDGAAASRRPRVEELMDMVQLDIRMGDRWPHELSGGQQQRVALARALAQRPRLMLLDEPFSALDTGLRAAMRKAVAQLMTRAGITSILVTHDQAEALSFADQLAVMRGGRLAQAGAPLDVYRYPCDEDIARFLGDAVVLPARIGQGWAECELGRVPVGDTTASGDARILLRPEQIRLAQMPEQAPAASCRGVVTDSDFGGHDCILTVRLAGATQRSLTVRSPSPDAPGVGRPVSLAVAGTAHVLRG
ncbi:ABC transporter ATP-binding protein [Paludibacterium yongneupense]|uniref:ABC transporter ATP-binding protein n=1 Tax=Paludibacterium yongneupense TaxID=400061 RepID=UPI0003FD71D1|nr:ABC transporter ATP-binding protein [Paludibacterium yongneupense]